MLLRTIPLLAALTFATSEVAARPKVEMPEFAGITHWFNTPKPLSRTELRGHVVLVDFWTYSCVNCLRTLPELRAWYQQYHDLGLEIVGVHSPEFSFEQRPENVQAAIDKLGLRYPVAMDNGHQTWNAYLNRYWPAEYLVDKDGFVRYQHFGEGNYPETERQIRALLVEGRPGLKLPPMTDVPRELPESLTPEIYLGSARLSALGNPEPIPRDGVVTLKVPGRTEPNHFYLEGEWRFAPEHVSLVSPTGRIVLQFQANQANMVLSADQGATATVLIDGQPATPQNKGSDVTLGNDGPAVRVKEARLYTLAEFPRKERGPARHTLELRLTGAGLRAYTFTFG